MGKIDDIDMKILTELVKDSSVSVPKLSRRINVNPSVAYSRIKRLVKRGVIKRFTVEVNEEILGYHVSAIIGVNIDSKLREEATKGLLALPEVRGISEVTGRFDIIAKVKTRTLEELRDLISNKIGKITGIDRTETFVEMRSMEKERSYSLELIKR